MLNTANTTMNKLLNQPPLNILKIVWSRLAFPKCYSIASASIYADILGCYGFNHHYLNLWLDLKFMSGRHIVHCRYKWGITTILGTEIALIYQLSSPQMDLTPPLDVGDPSFNSRCCHIPTWWRPTSWYPNMMVLRKPGLRSTREGLHSLDNWKAGFLFIFSFCYDM